MKITKGVNIALGGAAVNEYISANEFGDEVEKEALAQGDNSELARKKGQEAAGMYWAYGAGMAGGSILAKSRFGEKIATPIDVGGAIFGSKVMKPWIKNQVLPKKEEDYNKPLFDGTTVPGPG